MIAEHAYLFRHALLRDAAYQLQLPGDRAKLHGMALGILEGLSDHREIEKRRRSISEACAKARMPSLDVGGE